MAHTPHWKCYQNGQYRAACKYADDAAILMSGWSSGEVRYDHKYTVWTEGKESFSAGESYDGAANIMIARMKSQVAAATERFKERHKKAWAEISGTKTAFMPDK